MLRLRASRPIRYPEWHDKHRPGGAARVPFSSLLAPPVNPIYAGVGPFPRLVQDDAWVRGCARMIEEEGSEQVLVNLLYVLRECLGDGSSEESCS